MKKLLLAAAIHGYSSAMEMGRCLLVPFLKYHPRSFLWNLEERSVVKKASTPIDKKTIWLHAASLGEAKAAGIFLDILLKHDTETSFVLSATTRTGLEILKTRMGPHIAAARILPFDSIPLMSQMLETYRIGRVWLVETELWPSLLWICLRRNIPVGIVNARMEPVTYRQFSRFKWLIAPLFNHVGPVLAQTSDYAQRFIDLGVNPASVHVTGNLKSLVTIAPITPENRRSLRHRLGIDDSAVVITAGCVHAGEGFVLRDAADELTRRGIGARFCVVPRHLQETNQIIRELGKGTIHLTDLQSTATNWRFAVIEKIGIMEEAYGLADVAFIGGTFVRIGGHNVWDAARFAIPVFFGPLHHTQKAGCNSLMRTGVGFLITGGQDLGRGIAAVIGPQSTRIRTAFERLRQQMISSQSALERYLP